AEDRSRLRQADEPEPEPPRAGVRARRVGRHRVDARHAARRRTAAGSRDRLAWAAAVCGRTPRGVAPPPRRRATATRSGVAGGERGRGELVGREGIATVGRAAAHVFLGLLVLLERGTSSLAVIVFPGARHANSGRGRAASVSPASMSTDR